MIQLTHAHLAMILIAAAALAFGIGLICGVLFFDWLNARYEKNRKEYLNAPPQAAQPKRKASVRLKAIK